MNELILLKEDKEKGEVTILTPKCPKDEYIMSGFFYEFYKEPSFGMTEFNSSIFWVKMWFVCPKCNRHVLMPEDEVDILNSYTLDRINFPAGFDSKKMKVRHVTTK